MVPLTDEIAYHVMQSYATEPHQGEELWRRLTVKRDASTRSDSPDRHRRDDENPHVMVEFSMVTSSEDALTADEILSGSNQDVSDAILSSVTRVLCIVTDFVITTSLIEDSRDICPSFVDARYNHHHKSRRNRHLLVAADHNTHRLKSTRRNRLHSNAPIEQHRTTLDANQTTTVASNATTTTTIKEKPSSILYVNVDEAIATVIQKEQSFSSSQQQQQQQQTQSIRWLQIGVRYDVLDIADKYEILSDLSLGRQTPLQILEDTAQSALVAKIWDGSFRQMLSSNTDVLSLEAVSTVGNEAYFFGEVDGNRGFDDDDLQYSPSEAQQQQQLQESMLRISGIVLLLTSVMVCVFLWGLGYYRMHKREQDFFMYQEKGGLTTEEGVTEILDVGRLENFDEKPIVDVRSTCTTESSVVRCV